MRVLLSPIFICVAFVIPQPAKAQLKTGNDLYAACTASETSPTYYQQDAECAGYIAGATDAILSFGVDKKNGICVPAGVQLGQIGDLVRSFMRNHPEIRHSQASAMMLGALYEGFACKNQRTIRERG
jgi:hypothetical protein